MTIQKDLELFTIPDVQKKLKLGRSTVYGLLDSGKLRSIKLGNCRRVKSSDLLAYIESLGD
jgi:excisionase family DNA binding protein